MRALASHENTHPGEAAPCGWNRSRVMDFAEEAAKSLGYIVGQDLEPIVKKLGGKLTLADGGTGSTGYVKVDGPGQFEIFLSRVSSATRDRFTIAHELGHYILHSRMGEISPWTVKRDGTGRLEWEANWFAAGFLMPSEAFAAKAQEGFGNAALAVKFGVSEAAVAVRRETLGV